MEPNRTSPPTAYDSPEYAAKVEANVRQIQNGNRLAMYQWEDPDSTYRFPEWSQDLLKVPPEQIVHKLRAGTMPLMSASFIPSLASHKAIEPAFSYFNHVPPPCYYFDLTQQDALSPRVVRASTVDLDSGSDPLSKIFRLSERPGPITALRTFYDRFLTDQALRQFVAKGLHNREQLDALGNYYQRSRTPKLQVALPAEDPHIVRSGELIVAASMQHAIAISVPVYANEKADDAYLPLLHLTAAIAGLQHLDRGLDLPVMLYHVTPPQQGESTYFAQGREMLTAKAIEAVEQLQKSGLFVHFEHHWEGNYTRLQHESFHRSHALYYDSQYPGDWKDPWDRLKKVVQETLGIDLMKPLEWQIPNHGIREVTHEGRPISPGKGKA